MVFGRQTFFALRAWTNDKTFPLFACLMGDVLFVWTAAYETCLMRACLPRLLSGLYPLFHLCLYPLFHLWWQNMLMLKWVSKRLKHVWSNTDQTTDTSRWASVGRMPARAWPNEQNKAHQTRVQKKCFKLLLECLMAFKFYQTGPNTIKHIQTRSNSTKQGVQTVKSSVTK